MIVRDAEEQRVMVRARLKTSEAGGQNKHDGPAGRRQRRPPLGVQAFLDSADVSKSIAKYAPSATIFAQGDPCHNVMYIQMGAVRLSVLSSGGKEAIVAMLGPDDFLGEGALTAQCVRMATATAVAPTTLFVVPTDEMARLLHEEPGFSGRFIEHMLSRHIRIEEDLVDQLFNSSEKRLARTLLLLARYGEADEPQGVLPKLSHEMLAEMIGTTRSRVNFFMNKFRKLGLIEYNGGLTINSALLSVVLHD
jgi:CRP/FNR family cyclic AMP-dependent transcriptional regulator